MSETKMIKFRMNGKPLFAKKIDVNETLFQIRKKFENKLPNGSLFICSDGTKIELEDENDFALKDIAGNEDKTFIIHLNKKEEDTQNNYGIEKPKSDFPFDDQNKNRNAQQYQKEEYNSSNEKTDDHYYDRSQKNIKDKRNYLGYPDLDCINLDDRNEVINKKKNEDYDTSKNSENNKFEETPSWLIDEDTTYEISNENYSKSNFRENEKYSEISSINLNKKN